MQKVISVGSEIIVGAGTFSDIKAPIKVLNFWCTKKKMIKGPLHGIGGLYAKLLHSSLALTKLGEQWHDHDSGIFKVIMKFYNSDHTSVQYTK